MAGEQVSVHGRGGCGGAQRAYRWITHHPILARVLACIFLACVLHVPHTLDASTSASTADHSCCCCNCKHGVCGRELVCMVVAVGRGRL